MGIFVHFCVTLLYKLILLLFFLICSVWLLKSYTILELIKLYLTLEVFCILNLSIKILSCFWFTMFLISLESVIPHIIAYREIGLASNLIKIWIILILHDQFSFMERRCPMKVSRRKILVSNVFRSFQNI